MEEIRTVVKSTNKIRTTIHLDQLIEILSGHIPGVEKRTFDKKEKFNLLAPHGTNTLVLEWEEKSEHEFTQEAEYSSSAVPRCKNCRELFDPEETVKSFPGSETPVQLGFCTKKCLEDYLRK